MFLGIMVVAAAVVMGILVTIIFSKNTASAFVVQSRMPNENKNDGATSASGVPHSIMISSDSPSAISDSFGRSEATPGTKNQEKIFVREVASIIINV